MRERNTGGPAFPRDHASDGHNGMTLRDYFAGIAMMHYQAQKGPQTFQEVAIGAYMMADAMLKERDE